MFGTVARMQAKPGHEDQLIALDREWDEGRGRQVDGFEASYVFRSDESPTTFYLVAVFRDRESYQRNAQDPAQDEWYQRLRIHLDSDPEWHDGDVVFAGGLAATPGAEAYSRRAVSSSVEI